MNIFMSTVVNGAPFSYRNDKLIFMNKNMLRFVKWVLRAYNTGVFSSKYNFGINISTCETAAVHIATSSKRKSIIGTVYGVNTGVFAPKYQGFTWTAGGTV